MRVSQHMVMNKAIRQAVDRVRHFEAGCVDTLYGGRKVERCDPGVLKSILANAFDMIVQWSLFHRDRDGRSIRRSNP